MRESSFMFAFAHAGLAQSDGLAISILFGAASFVVGLVGGIVWIAYGLQLRTVKTSAHAEVLMTPILPTFVELCGRLR